MTSSGGAGEDSSINSADLRKLLASFRERFSTLHPVILQRAKLDEDTWGDTSIVKRKGQPHLLIRINKTLSSEAQFFVLMHELAHCVQWRANEEGRENDHDPEFGIAYARLWAQLIGG